MTNRNVPQSGEIRCKFDALSDHAALMGARDVDNGAQRCLVQWILMNPQNKLLIYLQVTRAQLHPATQTRIIRTSRRFYCGSRFKS